MGAFGYQSAIAEAFMDSASVAAASGLRARSGALDMLANNIANASTSGYKRDGEFYSLYKDAEAAEWGGVTGTLPLVEKAWIDLSQGTLTTSGRPLDLALSGQGFFAINSPGGTLYTRNGTFQRSADGQVTTFEGHALRLAGGGTLKIDPGPVEISTDGSVQQNGLQLGRLELVDFEPGSLMKQGATMFRAAEGATGVSARSVEVHQGKLEGANVSSAESAVRLVNLMRQFETLQKAITLSGEMSQKAISEVAKTGS